VSSTVVIKSGHSGRQSGAPARPAAQTGRRRERPLPVEQRALLERVRQIQRERITGVRGGGRAR